MATMAGGSPRVYDAIVVGVGGMGSAACYHLARRGLRTLGLERFDIPHTMGSSHGITRIIRLAYYEHPSYVPLLLRAFELWDELERESGRHLLEVTGTIDASGPDEIVFTGALAVLRAVWTRARGADLRRADGALSRLPTAARPPGAVPTPRRLPPARALHQRPRRGRPRRRCGHPGPGASHRLGTGGRRCTRQHRPRRLRGGETGARGRRLDGLAGSRARRSGRAGAAGAGLVRAPGAGALHPGAISGVQSHGPGRAILRLPATRRARIQDRSLPSSPGARSTRTISSARRARPTKHRCARRPHATSRRRTARPWPCAPACSPIPRTSISSSTCCRSIPRSWSPRPAPGTASSSPRSSARSWPISRRAARPGMTSSSCV